MATYRQYLIDLQGTFVHVDRGSPDACRGWLQAIRTDFITLLCPGFGLLHLPTHHIRNIGPELVPQAGPEPVLQAVPVHGEPPPPTFVQLLRAHTGLPVQLNHAGPEVASGTLLSVSDDHLVLETEPGTTVCFPLFHVRSLSMPQSPAFPGGTAVPLQGE